MNVNNLTGFFLVFTEWKFDEAHRKAWVTNSYQHIINKSNHAKNTGKDWTKIAIYDTSFSPTGNTMKNKLSIIYMNMKVFFKSLCNMHTNYKGACPCGPIIHFSFFYVPKNVKKPNTLNYPNSISKMLARSQKFSMIFENIAKCKRLCFLLHKNIFILEFLLHKNG